MALYRVKGQTKFYFIYAYTEFARNVFFRVFNAEGEATSSSTSVMNKELNFTRLYIPDDEPQSDEIFYYVGVDTTFGNKIMALEVHRGIVGNYAFSLKLQARFVDDIKHIAYIWDEHRLFFVYISQTNKIMMNFYDFKKQRFGRKKQL